MDDILSQGGDREPSRRPRRLAMIAALAGAAVAGAVYVGLPRHHRSPVAILSAPATVAPALTPAPVPTVVAALPGERSGIGGPTLPWENSLRLPLTGTRPVWFSPASDRSEPIGGLPDARSGYQFTRVSGGWAVLANPGPAGCGNCAGTPVTAWFLADGARSVTRVGTADLVAPSATAGAVWLTSYQPGVSLSTAAGTAREVSSTGAPLGPPVRLPAGYVIDQGTDRGLLLAPASPQSGTPVYQLWDPADPRAGRTFAAVLAASPTELAWTSRCDPTCQVQVLSLVTGRRAVIRLPAANSAASGAFSPGGALLALQVSSGDSGDDGALAMRLEVASAATGQLTAVPGIFVSSDALVGFGWPASGDSLVAEFIFATKAQLASWHPGAARPAVTVIRLGTAEDSLILG